MDRFLKWFISVVVMLCFSLLSFNIHDFEKGKQSGFMFIFYLIMLSYLAIANIFLYLKPRYSYFIFVFLAFLGCSISYSDIYEIFYDMLFLILILVLSKLFIERK